MSDLKNYIDILELLSIVAGAIFGILGTLTETKTKTGKLTKWGVIAVLGVVVTNTFSFIQASLKQKNDTQKENAKLKDENEKYKEQLGFEYTTVRKIDSSLNAQILLQHQTDCLNIKQNGIYHSQAGILERQSMVNDNINRSLNPFLPFAISFTISLKITDEALKLKDDPFIVAHKNLLKILDNPASYNNDTIALQHKKGIEALVNTVYLTPKYVNLSDFKFLESGIVMLSFRSNKKQTNRNINFKFPIFSFDSSELTVSGHSKYKDPYPNDSSYDDSHILEDLTNNANTGIRIIYVPQLKSYKISFYIDELKVSSDLGTMKSTEDLPGSTLLLIIGGHYLSTINLEDCTLFFPPSFSKRFELAIGNNSRQDNERGDVSYFETVKIK